MEIETLLKNTWNIFQKDLVTYIIGALITIFGSIILITSAPLAYGLAHMAAKGTRGEKIEVTDVFAGFKLDKFIQSWLLFLIIMIPIFIGFLLLVIPGIIISIAFAIIFLYALPLMVVNGTGAVDSLKESLEMAKTNPQDTIILVVLVMVLNAIGSAIWIGTILTMPFTMLMLILALPMVTGAKPEMNVQDATVSEV
ncbi:glycerophosphodiester phosphodiesterase [Methanomethylovorans sp.]|uniref:glycerophosphodiester phosphodiesterase n=1 Tax=Methanomethylovorans sp. TaxID=2758717 RepID=UPI000B023A91|nr:glycerophosphodiester phosphodiesterase [Methanomethylovorans sp.]